MAESNTGRVPPPTENEIKRRRERRFVILTAILFVVSIVVQVFVSDRGEQVGLVNSVLFFGLLHLNVLLIMVLVFLVLRNIVRAFLARQQGGLGSSLRWRLVLSLLAFSTLPSILLFLGSFFLMRESFDRWFGNQVGSALRDAQDVSQVLYEENQQNLEFFSNQIILDLQRRPLDAADVIASASRSFPFHSIELYQNAAATPIVSKGQLRQTEGSIPRATAETIERALRGSPFHLTRNFGQEDLIQYVLPFEITDRDVRVLVLSYRVPLALRTRMADLKNAFDDYSQIVQFKSGLKANYTLILFTLFVLVMFVVTWFGISITKSVIDPVSELMKATEAFRSGRWQYRIPLLSPDLVKKSKSGGDLEVLKASFNLMAEEVGRRGRQLEEANAQLLSLVRDLEEREGYLENLIGSIRRGVVVVNEQMQLLRVNIEASHMAGRRAGRQGARELSVKEVRGRSWFEVFPHLGSREQVENWFTQVRSASGKPVDVLLENSGTDPGVDLSRIVTYVSVRATGVQMTDEQGRSLGILVILEDVSDAARLERFTAWQEVARRIAHEIRNPLTPIQISVDRLVRRFHDRLESDPDNGPLFRECVQQIQKQVRVIRELVREFSEFAKLPEPRLKDVDLIQTLEQLVADYRFQYPKIKFQLEFSNGIGSVIRADPEYMRRLLVNLGDNAIHSLQEAAVSDAEVTFRLSPSNRGDRFVRIEVEDNGPGIAPELRERIFDPYVTTRSAGLGLGLAIVRRIVIEHQGSIRCDQGARGALFVIEFPLKPPDTPLADPAEQQINGIEQSQS